MTGIPYNPKGTFAMHENIEKKDFCLYPLKLKALDSALGLPAAKREGLGRNYRQPIIYNPRLVFYGIFHITQLRPTHYSILTFGIS